MACPITLLQFHEIPNPVAIGTESVPYELDALCDWLEVGGTNPLTGRAVCVCELVALGTADQQRQTVELIRRRRLKIVESQVFLIILFSNMAEMQPLLVEEEVVTCEYKVRVFF
jgi:hypothetical protein